MMMKKKKGDSVYVCMMSVSYVCIDRFDSIDSVCLSYTVKSRWRCIDRFDSIDLYVDLKQLSRWR